MLENFMIQFIFTLQCNQHIKNCNHHYNRKLEFVFFYNGFNSLENTKTKMLGQENYCNHKSIHIHLQKLHLNLFIICATLVTQNIGHFIIIKRVILKLNLNTLNLLFIIAEGTMFFHCVYISKSTTFINNLQYTKIMQFNSIVKKRK